MRFDCLLLRWGRGYFMNRRKTLCWARVDLNALNLIGQVALRTVVCLVHAHSDIGVVA